MTLPRGSGQARIRLVRAPNPSPMTLTGTNSYLIDCGGGQAVCIDPGPAIAAHLDALLQTSERMNCRLVQICLTHGHPDHAPAAALLRERAGAPIAAHAKVALAHDRDLADGDVLRVGDTELRVFEAPGHSSDHLVFYEPREGALFTGDVVLGEGYVVIAPPDGDMRSYTRTLERLASEFPNARTIYGGHGEPVTDPAAKLRDYLAHRQTRESELVAVLRAGKQTIPELVATIYARTDRTLWPAAARQLLAYLIALEQEGRVRSRELRRPLTADEQTILNPPWSSIVGPDQAALLEEGLGTDLRIDNLREYSLV